MPEIDIEDIEDRDKLLYALWASSKLALFHKLYGQVPSFVWTGAKKGYNDYVNGRVIKTDVYNDDKINPRLYDRDNGEGAFAKVVEKVRAGDYDNYPQR